MMWVACAAAFLAGGVVGATLIAILSLSADVDQFAAGWREAMEHVYIEGDHK